MWWWNLKFHFWTGFSVAYFIVVFFSYMLEYNLSEGSYLWNHNAVVIYLRGICHEEDSIIFKVLSFNAIFNSMDYYNVFH